MNATGVGRKGGKMRRAGKRRNEGREEEMIDHMHILFLSGKYGWILVI